MKKLYVLFSFFLTFLTACMKDTLDPPANPKDPNIVANYTIFDLKQDFKATGQTIWTIQQDKIIEAIVSANDIQGNFYKEIVVQDMDNRAAIGLLINRTNLYNDFPVGRKVFLKVKGMAIANQNNLIVLGGYIDTITIPGAKSLAEIPPTAIDRTILKGSIGNPVKVDQITIGELSEAYHYKLVRFKEVEFKCEDTKVTYADAVGLRDANRTLLDKNGNDVIVRTSGYANFAGTKVASGKGDLTGIFTVYRSDFQLKLRTLDDVSLTDSNRTVPCSGSGGGSGGGSGTPTLASIASIRTLFSGNGAKIFDKYVEGVVISDKDGKNINSQNLVLQDASGGIVIRFASSHSYALGDKLKVSFNGDSLTKFNQLMQVFVPSSAVSKIGTGTITPATVTISDINANIDTYESTLVKLMSVKFTGTGTYNGSKNLSDGTATITHYTQSAATFSGSTLPGTTISKNITAIVGRFGSTKQVSIRNLSDVE